MTMAAVPYQVMRRILPNAACSGLPLMPLDAPAGRVFATYFPGAAMVIDVVCGPMAYKTQLLAYHYVENQLLIFVME